MTLSTIDRAIKELKDAGAIKVDKQHDAAGNLQASLYTIYTNIPTGGGLGSKKTVGAKISGGRTNQVSGEAELAKHMKHAAR